MWCCLIRYFARFYNFVVFGFSESGPQVPPRFDLGCWQRWQDLLLQNSDWRSCQTLLGTSHQATGHSLRVWTGLLASWQVTTNTTSKFLLKVRDKVNIVRFSTNVRPLLLYKLKMLRVVSPKSKVQQRIITKKIANDGCGSLYISKNVNRWQPLLTKRALVFAWKIPLLAI